MPNSPAHILSTSRLARISLRPGLGLALVILGIITVGRLVGLCFSAVELSPDESQYWSWSRELAVGYVTKPPLLAWIIALVTHVCGDSEACVRAPCPLFYLGTSLLVYAIAAKLYDVRIAFFAALSIALAPGAAFSARIISTDVPLLFLWALALFAYVNLLAARDLRWSVLLGLAIGFGLLAKYAMIYFLLGIGLAALLDREARRLLSSPVIWIVLGVALLVIAPNAVWNLAHKFATLREVEHNAVRDGLEFNWRHGVEFIGSQFGVFGPVLFAVLLAVIVRFSLINGTDRVMLAFAIPPLALIVAIAFVTRANANWAATSFVSGVIVAVALLVRLKASKLLAASLGFGLGVQILLLIGDAFATKIHLPLGARGDVYARTLGWRSLAEQAGAMARRVGAPTIVSDWHAETASLFYYWRDQPEQILAWLNQPTPQDNFELTHPFSEAAAQPALFVTRCTNRRPLSDYFSNVERLGVIVAPSGPFSGRRYEAFKLSVPRGPIPPLGNCDD